MEEKNRVKNENVLEKVQGGVNLNGGKEIANDLSRLTLGGSIINKDAKNTGGNNSVFIKKP